MFIVESILSHVSMWLSACIRPVGTKLKNIIKDSDKITFVMTLIALPYSIKYWQHNPVREKYAFEEYVVVAHSMFEGFTYLDCLIWNYRKITISNASCQSMKKTQQEGLAHV